VLGLAFFLPAVAQEGDAVADKSIEELVDDAFRATPYFADGKVMGYRVYPGPNRELFYSLGLNPGDVLTNFNGKSMNDIGIFFEFLRLLAKGEIVRLMVGELGESETIEIQIPKT
jgi:general secretion pathway protein C